MQTNSIKGKSISTLEAIREVGADMAKFGESPELNRTDLVSPI